ncbi:unnamed protein product [Lampetra planeri]
MKLVWPFFAVLMSADWRVASSHGSADKHPGRKSPGGCAEVGAGVDGEAQLRLHEARDLRRKQLRIRGPVAPLPVACNQEL